MVEMNCTMIGPGCPADGSSLSYAPSLPARIIFMVFFSFSFVGHLLLGWKYKAITFMIAMLLGSSSEVVGYLGRLLMHNNPYKLSTFLVQIVCLTTAPAFYSAGIYLCLSRKQVRPHHKGVTSSATTTSTMDLGNHLMLAGLIFQIVSLLLFTVACVDFALRIRRYQNWKNPAYRKLRANGRFGGFLWALSVAFVTIFTRCVYRVIELGGGWNNSLMREEPPYIFLESCMITIAVFALIIFHPGSSFQNRFNDLEAEQEPSAGASRKGRR